VLPVLAKVAVAGFLFLVIWRAGRAMLGGLVRPMPAPPPPGELRKVKITFRCAICGTEVRMTVANDEVPEPPRHCMDEMELVAPTLE
jgi:threonine dehydrogenase-like Zn-dependent dehydrogenase